jgi:hypothetical protein
MRHDVHEDALADANKLCPSIFQRPIGTAIKVRVLREMVE